MIMLMISYINRTAIESTVNIFYVKSLWACSLNCKYVLREIDWMLQNKTIHLIEQLFLMNLNEDLLNHKS